jgi:2-polyprenyl-3-methyl-5-hydroxy-6-metoxy-1,4-benzoquinol methylase
MEHFDRKNHWDTIYTTKPADQVSWYQPTPAASLEQILQAGLKPDASIIDIGGGDSFLVDHLLQKGFTNISVLDISQAAIDRAKKRLGDLASKVNWIVSDIIQFQPKNKYDFWHDRAAFHFLTTPEEIEKYVQVAAQSINDNGTLFIGTFSTQGPNKCSGIDIQQYSEQTLESTFDKHFNKIKCFETEHTTPFDTVQNFIFCSFHKN